MSSDRLFEPALDAGDAESLGRLLDELPSRDDARVAERAARMAAPDDTLLETVVSLLEVTSLEATDTPRRVADLAARARDPGAGLPPAAGVCVWPDLVGVVADALVDSPVRAVAVAGAFPSGRSPLDVRIAEVEAAVAAGAEEIDVVLDRAAVLDGREWDALMGVAALRRACGDASCKVILETGALPDADAIARATWIALLGGADMVKTSTGTTRPGATPAALLVLLEEARDFEERTGRPVGVKVAGGIREVGDATSLLALVREVAGAQWLVPDRARVGASALLAAVAERRGQGPIGR